MSLRNFDKLLKPQSIALIGASKRADAVGTTVARNLFHAGFEGPILPVHPKHRSIESNRSNRRSATTPSPICR